jgi:hypothetical protein
MPRLVRPQHVVVHRVLGEHPAEVSLAEDQHSVGEFGGMVSARRSAKQFAPWTPWRDLDHRHPRIRQHRVERGRECT